jgi:hypothetical protein
MRNLLARGYELILNFLTRRLISTKVILFSLAMTDWLMTITSLTSMMRLEMFLQFISINWPDWQAAPI